LKKLEWNMAEFAFISPLESDYTEPANYAQAMKSSDKANWLDAIETEFKRIGERKVWMPIKLADVPDGKKPFGTKWVFKKKDNGVFRARLVALGYNQIPGVDFTDRFSPVVHDMTWRLLLTIFMGQDKNWVAEQIDVETAFLYGDLEEPVYLKCPEGYSLPPGHVLQLDKALYGLVQAARQFYKKFASWLTDEHVGFTRSMADPCLFHRVNDLGTVMLVTHVDDCLVIGTEAAVIDAIGKIKEHFNIKQLGRDFEEYLRCTLKKAPDGIVIQQDKLVATIPQKFQLPDRSFNTPAAPGNILYKPKEGDVLVSPEEQNLYRSGTGKLLYLVKMSRPDIANCVRELSKHMGKTTSDHLKALDRVLGYVMKTQDYGIKLHASQSTKEIDVVAYADATYATDQDNRKSVTGYLIYVNGSLIMWKSKMQESVTLSSTEAEYVAISQCLTDMLFIKAVGESMNVKVKVPMTVLTDNTGAIDLIYNWTTAGRTRHIDIRHHFMRDLADEGIF
jgi:hypothetical protein